MTNKGNSQDIIEKPIINLRVLGAFVGKKKNSHKDTKGIKRMKYDKQREFTGYY